MFVPPGSVLWVWIVVAGCGGSEPAPAEPEPTLEQPPIPLETAGAADAIVALHMGAHAHKVTAARNALVMRGDLVIAKAHLQWLADHSPPVGIPADGAPYLSNMQRIAKEGATASRPDGVAAALGELAVTCGNCHAALNATLKVAPDVPDALGTSHAETHALGAEQLWTSLVTSTPDLWRQGLLTLGSDDPASSFETPPPPSTRPYTTTAHRSVDAGMSSTQPAERGRLYGKVLAACAGCHADVLSRD